MMREYIGIILYKYMKCHVQGNAICIAVFMKHEYDIKHENELKHEHEHEKQYDMNTEHDKDRL